jgi:hypothetical protein
MLRDLSLSLARYTQSVYQANTVHGFSMFIPRTRLVHPSISGQVCSFNHTKPEHPGMYTECIFVVPKTSERKREKEKEREREKKIGDEAREGDCKVS